MFHICRIYSKLGIVTTGIERAIRLYSFFCYRVIQNRIFYNRIAMYTVALHQIKNIDGS